jgi:hypothetical protein
MLMSKLFIFMPRLRTIGKTHVALWEARQKWGKPHMYVEYQHDQPSKDGYTNVTHNYELARQHFLTTDCDMFLAIEDDIIVPPHAILALADMNVDVAMGVYCLRQLPNHRWNAFVTVSDSEGLSITEDNVHRATKLAKNQEIAEVAGVGLGCTLIQRHVLQNLKFEKRGGASNDWYFSIDCQANGYGQFANFGVMCGHVMTKSTRYIVYPDYMGDNLHRKEQL